MTLHGRRDGASKNVYIGYKLPTCVMPSERSALGDVKIANVDPFLARTISAAYFDVHVSMDFRDSASEKKLYAIYGMHDYNPVLIQSNV